MAQPQKKFRNLPRVERINLINQLWASLSMRDDLTVSAGMPMKPAEAVKQSLKRCGRRRT